MGNCINIRKTQHLQRNTHSHTYIQYIRIYVYTYLYRRTIHTHTYICIFHDIHTNTRISNTYAYIYICVCVYKIGIYIWCERDPKESSWLCTFWGVCASINHVRDIISLLLTPQRSAWIWLMGMSLLGTHHEWTYFLCIIISMHPKLEWMGSVTVVQLITQVEVQHMQMHSSCKKTWRKNDQVRSGRFDPGRLINT